VLAAVARGLAAGSAGRAGGWSPRARLSLVRSQPPPTGRRRWRAACRCVRVPCAYAFYRAGTAHASDATAAHIIIIIIILLLNFVDDSKHDRRDYVSIAAVPVRDNDKMFF